MKTKALSMAAVVALSSIATPAAANHWHHSYSEQCYRFEIREEYVPGNYYRPGYVTRRKVRVRIPCREVQVYTPKPTITQPHINSQTDENSCIEGALLGGILGGGLGAAASRQEGRFWAIPLGIVGGSLVGCQVDGG